MCVEPVCTPDVGLLPGAETMCLILEECVSVLCKQNVSVFTDFSLASRKILHQ